MANFYEIDKYCYISKSRLDVQYLDVCWPLVIGQEMKVELDDQSFCWIQCKYVYYFPPLFRDRFHHALINFQLLTLCKKCPYSELFWSALSLIRTEQFVSLRIQSECGKIRTRIIPNTETIYAMFFFRNIQTIHVI